MSPLRIAISEDAIQDLKDHGTFIRQDNPDAAERFIEGAERSFDVLAQTPLIGPARAFKSRKLRGLRSWRIHGFENYLVFYCVSDDQIDIVRVLHGAMDLEREFL
jgi:toxin ParE1/3/4